MLGMGLVVNDFIGKITWRNILAYNPVEYFALILSASGVIISLILGIQSLYQWIIDQRNRKKWVKQTVLSSTKE
jgi:ABC-type transport system involved in cytochrome c biogenesis permease subunit